MTKKIGIVVFCAIALWAWLHRADPVSLGPGVMAAEAPVQTSIHSPQTIRIGAYQIHELAEFTIKAKVLSRKDYDDDREADLSSLDLALGWGRMSDESILEKIEISQSGRWYRWRVKEFPIPHREIETHSANMHLIPADDSVKETLDAIRPGEIVQISGSLVSVTAEDGWRWQSSMTREDTGNGACELIYARDVQIVSR